MENDITVERIYGGEVIIDPEDPEASLTMAYQAALRTMRSRRIRNGRVRVSVIPTGDYDPRTTEQINQSVPRAWTTDCFDGQQRGSLIDESGTVHARIAKVGGSWVVMMDGDTFESFSAMRSDRESARECAESLLRLKEPKRK